MRPDYYSSTTHCDNCGQQNILSIPKGVTIRTHLQEKRCDNCGCRLRGDHREDYRYGEPIAASMTETTEYARG